MMGKNNNLSEDVFPVACCLGWISERGENAKTSYCVFCMRIRRILYSWAL